MTPAGDTVVSALRELVALVVGGGGPFSPEMCTLRQKNWAVRNKQRETPAWIRDSRSFPRLLVLSESYTLSSTKASKEVGAGRWPFREDWRFFLPEYWSHFKS